MEEAETERALEGHHHVHRVEEKDDGQYDHLNWSVNNRTVLDNECGPDRPELRLSSDGSYQGRRGKRKREAESKERKDRELAARKPRFKAKNPRGRAKRPVSRISPKSAEKGGAAQQ